MKEFNAQFLLLLSLALLSATGILMLVYYDLGNKTAHTGSDPWWLLGLLAPVLITNFIFQFFGSPFKRILAISNLICLMGILYLIFLDYSGTLLQYERWIRRGMPGG